MKYYQLPNSHSCAKVSILLYEKNISCDRPAFDMKFLRSEEYLRLSPYGKVPCLVDGALAIPESEVICEYLETKYPNPPMMPQAPGEAARVRVLSRLHDFHVSPIVASLFVPLLDGRIAHEKLNDAGGRERLAQLHVELTKIEGLVTPSPYLAGAKFSVADAAFALTVWYAEHCGRQYGDLFSTARYPKLSKWFAKIQERPSVARVIAECRAANGLTTAAQKAA